MLLTTVRVARSRPTDQNRTSPSCPPKAMAAHAGPRGERPALPRTELARQRSPFPLLRSSASTTARGSRRSRRERPAPNPRYRHPVAYRAPPAIAVLAEGRPRWVGHPEEPLSNVGAGTAGVGFGVAGAEFASSPVEVLWVIACSALLVRPCRMCGVLVLHRRHRPGRSPPGSVLTASGTPTRPVSGPGCPPRWCLSGSATRRSSSRCRSTRMSSSRTTRRRPS